MAAVMTQKAHHMSQHGSADSLHDPALGDDIIIVVDPASRKLPLPVAAVYPTLATTRRCDRTPSLCMLFIQGRCRQGASCHQVHAEASIVHRLRADAASRPTCCVHHGDDHEGVSVAEVAPHIKTFSIEGIGKFPAHALATTNGSRKALEDAPRDSVNVELCKSLICRLHVVGRCRFSGDCNFVHVCGELTAQDPALWGATRRDGATTERRAKKGKGDKHATPAGPTADPPSLASSFTSFPASSVTGYPHAVPPSPPMHNTSNSGFANGYSTPPTGYLPSPLLQGCGMMQSGSMRGFGSPTAPQPHSPQRSPMYPSDINTLCFDSNAVTPQLTPQRLSASWTHDPYSWGALPPAIV